MPAIAGLKIGAWSLTEPNTGSDISGIQTVAHRTPGGYRLSGRKTWITTGVAPDYVIVAAKTDRAKRAEGLSLFLVEKETPGFGVARRIETLGVRASHTIELVLDDCELPEDHLLGGEGNGMEYIRLVMAEARLITGAIALGIARAALDASIAYSQARQQFGQPIAKFQAIKFRLADMATDLEAARYMVYGAAKLSDQGLPCVKEAAMAKLFASEAVMRITDSAARIYASYGFAMEYPIQRYLRDARVTIIGGGTSEIMRHVIGKEMGL
jgi:butyryl-CoA dehydrogenase